MNDIHFTADPHFQHANIIKYCNRPFKDVEEQDETLITNWNSVVRPDGIIYIVGDFGFGSLERILRRLNGTKFLVLGSHDKSAQSCSKYFAKMSPLMEITVEDQPIVLCHYAMRVWGKSHYGSWHLYGHSHGKLEGQGKSFDVGVDSHNFFPWSFEEIKKEMNSRPDNFNLRPRGVKDNMAVS